MYLKWRTNTSSVNETCALKEWTLQLEDPAKFLKIMSAAWAKYEKDNMVFPRSSLDSQATEDYRRPCVSAKCYVHSMWLCFLFV